MRLPVLLLAAMVTAATADVITITPNADTTLFERDPNNNWGAQSDLVAGTLNTTQLSRALLSFDVAGAIPAGSTVTSAKITLRVVMTPNGPVNSNFELYRVVVPWTEGTKSGGIPGGAAATTGETTWNSRSHPSNDWTNPGGKLEVDFAEDPSAIATNVGGLGSYIFNLNFEGINDLQSMLIAPTSNHGWVLLSNAENTQKTARRWGAREHPTDPPTLEITFTPPPPPPPFEVTDADFDPTTRILTVTFDGIMGNEYELETRADLTAGDWAAVSSVMATSDGQLTLTTTAPVGAKRLFFRVTRL